MALEAVVRTVCGRGSGPAGQTEIDSAAKTAR
jgi:hypothetical protein